MDLLNNTIRNEFTGLFGSFFQTMSSGNNNFISIIKQPIQNIINTDENVMAGYSADSMNKTDITYTPVTGVYPALIIYPHQMNSNQFGQLKFQLDQNQIMVKVDSDCKDYLLNGKTERIIVNDLFYNHELTYNLQNYFGLKYYYFKLTSTK